MRLISEATAILAGTLNEGATSKKLEDLDKSLRVLMNQFKLMPKPLKAEMTDSSIGTAFSNLYESLDTFTKLIRNNEKKFGI